MTSNTITIHMVSGQKLSLQKLMLYPAPILSQAANARASAMKALGGTGVGLGVFGTPGVALAGAVALGVLSSLMASAANKAAAESLQKAQATFDKAKEKGRYFDITEIAGLHVPDPTAWSALGDSCEALVSISAFSKDEKKRFCEMHNLKYGAFMDTNVLIPIPVPYAHSGEDFVYGTDESGEVAFRWSHVEAFVPIHLKISYAQPVAEPIENKPLFIDWRPRGSEL
jgi:hypothetical protein